MKFHQSKEAQNLLYKLDTLKRRFNESQQDKDSPPPPKPAEEEIKAPTFTTEQVQLC